jgi:hypothetical protein
MDCSALGSIGVSLLIIVSNPVQCAGAQIAFNFQSVFSFVGAILAFEYGHTVYLVALIMRVSRSSSMKSPGFHGQQLLHMVASALSQLSDQGHLSSLDLTRQQR